MSFVISCSPGPAACQNLWSTPYGFRFHPAGAVTKINDLIFVVLAEWQQLCPRWLTPSSLPCLTLSSKHGPKCPDPPPVAASHSPAALSKVDASSGLGGMVFIPQGWEQAKWWANVLRGFLAFLCSVLVAWFGVGFLGEREEEPGYTSVDSAADTSSDRYLFLQP